MTPKKEYSDDKIDLALLTKDVEYIKIKIDEINSKLEKDYVDIEKHCGLERRVQFLERVVFGLISLIVVAVITAILKLVIFP
jgi:hypothetical protein